MNTPAHLIIGAAAFGRPEARGTIWAALAGGFAPDLSLYLMSAVARFYYDIPWERIFRELYYSEPWQQVFAVDNSFILWGLAFGVALWRKWHVTMAFTGAALLHLVLDFPLHNHDARMHFWPLTDWKFFSPISYWQGSRGGDVVGMIEIGLSAVLLVLLFRRYKALGPRIVFGLLGLAQVSTTQIWRLFF